MTNTSVFSLLCTYSYDIISFTIWTLHLKDLVFLLDFPPEANLWHHCHREGNIYRWLTQAMVHPSQGVLCWGLHDAGVVMPVLWEEQKTEDGASSDGAQGPEGAVAPQMERMAVSEQSPCGSRQQLKLMPSTYNGLCLRWLLFLHCA